ncbi:nicotinate-nucleotide--dimethylbenzimidazole phosphoribosyltransferase [Salinivirga cyanobacteriivorans]|nr:nicotinate-nucleotide--dimethylbenzimidazole phosphoribosyltransferase [Salinivirga cyanobacteriivorans]
MNFDIKAVGNTLDEKILYKINNKTKPPGSLGKLEKIALQIGKIQQTESPKLINPCIMVFAGDHGVVEEGVSPFPQEVTHQMVLNFLNGGAAINVFAGQNSISLQIIDAGVNFDFTEHPALNNQKVAKGTRNFAKEPAMSIDQCNEALQRGADLVSEKYKEGTNIIGFGEMGIGNTTAASALFSAYSGLEPAKTSGRGTGLDEDGVSHKAEVIQKAINKYGNNLSAIEILATYGGYEIAMTTGAMLKAAELGMCILVDGFIITSALIAAQALSKHVVDYCIFSHQSNEQGHRLMLEYLDAEPIMQLDLRLGEGTGAAIAYPVVKSAVNFLNEMASFDDAKVSNKE